MSEWRSASAWLVEISLQLGLGGHVLVVGAERDRAFDGKAVAEPGDAAERLLHFWGFREVVRWSPSHSVNVPDRGDDGCDGVAQHLIATAEQPELSRAVLIEAADLLADQLTEVGVDAVRRLLALPSTGRQRSAVVMLAADEERLPIEWRRDNRVTRVVARPPAQAVRRDILTALGDEFHEWDGGEALDVLVPMTEGLAVFELQALAATSRRWHVPASEPRRLLRVYRAGIDADPWEALNRDRLDAICRALRQRVVGQDEALDAVEEKLRSARVGLRFAGSSATGTRRPRMTLFLVGPTGVGKTELTRALADLIFGDQDAVIRLDMNEFKEAHAGERLGGAPPGYVGYGDTTFADRVAQRPFSVVLFDEIEKADGSIWDRLMGVIDEGRLTDGRGNTVNFGDTIVMFTSNEGASTIAEQGAEPLPQLRTRLKDAVKTMLVEGKGRPEVHGRLEEAILVFDALRLPVVPQLVGKLMNDLRQQAFDRYRLTLEADDAAIADAVVTELSRQPEGCWHGRSVRSELEKLVNHPLSDFLLAHDLPRYRTVRITTTGKAVSFELGAPVAEDAPAEMPV